MRRAVVGLVLLVAASSALAGERAYRSSRPGDDAQYRLVEKKREGDLVKTLHKKITSDGGVGFTRTEIDCSTGKFHDLEYGEFSPKKMRPFDPPKEWSETVPGSARADLVKLVCGKR